MRHLPAIVMLSLVLVFPACEDDSGTAVDPMVTVAGVVRNVDDGSFAQGVRVRLWNTSYADDVPTGSDGTYELKVPRGSKLLLFTDDFDAGDDVWFPLVNCDPVPVYANDDMLDVPIHCCPKTVSPNPGSVAIWDNYLANCDDTENGDMFEPHSSAAAKGIFSSLVVSDCSFTLADSINVVTGTPGAPIGYINENVVSFAPAPVASECNIFHPASVSQTGSLGYSQGFFDDSFVGSTITVTVTDNDAARNIDFPASIEVPVAPGTISLLVICVWNGKAINFGEMENRCGW